MTFQRAPEAAVPAIAPLTIARRRNAGKPTYHLVGGWPDEIAVNREVFEKAACMTLDGSILSIELENGAATYEITAKPKPDVLHARKLKGVMSDVAKGAAL